MRIYTHVYIDMESIEHDGIVIAVDGNKATIRIVQQAACAGCHAKSMCQASELKLKEVEAEMAEPLDVNTEVIVSLEQHLGWKAVLYTFILPLFVMMAMLFLGQHYWPNPSWLSGTIAIAILAPYYLILHQFEGRFRKQYQFVARKR